MTEIVVRNTKVTPPVTIHQAWSSTEPSAATYRSGEAPFQALDASALTAQEKGMFVTCLWVDEGGTAGEPGTTMYMFPLLHAPPVFAELVYGSGGFGTGVSRRTRGVSGRNNPTSAKFELHQFVVDSRNDDELTRWLYDRGWTIEGADLRTATVNRVHHEFFYAYRNKESEFHRVVEDNRPLLSLTQNALTELRQHLRGCLEHPKLRDLPLQVRMVSTARSSSLVGDMSISSELYLSEYVSRVDTLHRFVCTRAGLSAVPYLMTDALSAANTVHHRLIELGASTVFRTIESLLMSSTLPEAELDVVIGPPTGSAVMGLNLRDELAALSILFPVLHGVTAVGDDVKIELPLGVHILLSEARVRIVGDVGKLKDYIRPAEIPAPPPANRFNRIMQSTRPLPEDDDA